MGQRRAVLDTGFLLLGISVDADSRWLVGYEVWRQTCLRLVYVRLCDCDLVDTARCSTTLFSAHRTSFHLWIRAGWYAIIITFDGLLISIVS